jgi:hypothetical protein
MLQAIWALLDNPNVNIDAYVFLYTSSLTLAPPTHAINTHLSCRQATW